MARRTVLGLQTFNECGARKGCKLKGLAEEAVLRPHPEKGSSRGVPVTSAQVRESRRGAFRRFPSHHSSFFGINLWFERFRERSPSHRIGLGDLCQAAESVLIASKP